MPKDEGLLPRMVKPEDALGLIHAALSPDQRDFREAYLGKGKGEPSLSDFWSPSGLGSAPYHEADRLRGEIVRSLASQLIPSASNPQATLGEARSIAPNFPAPPGATREQELPGPGAPVPRFSPEELSQYNMPSEWAGHMQEGPRPTVTEEDPNTILPRSHQNLLVAKTHQAGLRPYAPNTMMKSELLNRLRQLRSGEAQPEYDNELQDTEVLLGITPKEHDPTSAAGRLQLLEEAKRKAQLPFAGPQAQATLEKTQAGTEGIQANTLTENTLRQAKLDKLTAQAQLAEKQASLAGDLKQSEVMKQKVLMFNMLKHGIARGEIDSDEELALTNSILSGTGLEATANQPGAFRSFFGLSQPGVHVGPKVGGPQPGQSSQPNQPSQSSQPTSDFKDAPAGKAVGDILKKDGKPVARWNGSSWQAIR